jgi:hypothetical protein
MGKKLKGKKLKEAQARAKFARKFLGGKKTTPRQSRRKRPDRYDDFEVAEHQYPVRRPRGKKNKAAQKRWDASLKGLVAKLSKSQKASRGKAFYARYSA